MRLIENKGIRESLGKWDFLDGQAHCNVCGQTQDYSMMELYLHVGEHFFEDDSELDDDIINRE